MRLPARFGLLALTLAVAGGCAPVPEGAAEPLPQLAGRTISAGCRQDQCRWLWISDVASVSRVPEGELRRMIVREGSSLHREGNLPDRAEDAQIEWQARDSVDYVFCSMRRPAFAFERDTGGLIVHFLDLFDPAGYQYASAELYMRFCHGREHLPREAVLRRLGYRPGTRSGQVEDATPETMTRF